VADFIDELQRHPLVFRKRNMNHNEFPEQLKLAISDLIRDEYLTQEAYKMGYDHIPEVKRNTEIWRDYLLANYQKNRFLAIKGIQNIKYTDAISQYLNPYIDRLQKKYNNIIKINTDIFEKINLTQVDMSVSPKNLPFPVIVPDFPLLTTDKTLDYGRK
jgi:vacuolar-type H+-ATPase catalytic subunit A/Vma1